MGRGQLGVALSIVVALALLLPLGLLGLDARSAGWTEIHRVLFRERSWFLFQHTVVISLLVVLLAAAVGVTAAWITERARIPGRRVWTVLLVLPVAIPDFVVGYAWHSIDPTINGLLGATLVMTLGTYPLVYLPVAAALRRTDPAMEDTAYSLGAGRLSTFFRVTLPLIRTAVLGGCVLVVAHRDLGIRSVRDPPLPDLHHRDLHRVPVRLSSGGGPVCTPGVPRSSRARRRRHHSEAGCRLGSDPARDRAARDCGGLSRRHSWRSVRSSSSAWACLSALSSTGSPRASTPHSRPRPRWLRRPGATVTYSALGAVVAVVLALPVAMLTFRHSSAPRDRPRAQHIRDPGSPRGRHCA